jgi:hypothetical protein
VDLWNEKVDAIWQFVFHQGAQNAARGTTYNR